MNKKLTGAEYVFVGSMLFGMLFGAGNLIFPVHMGQLAGSHFWMANFGFISTGVFLPFLALIAFGLSGSASLEELAGNVHPTFAKIFTVLLYLTIGPAFALPRTATVSYQIGIAPFVGEQPLLLAIFTFVFMGVGLLFSLKPSKLIVYIGKGLNPIFLVFLAILMAAALLNPMGSMGSALPQGDYVAHAFLTGFKEGYNTMDVLAMLAFSVVVIDTLKNLGITDTGNITKDLLLCEHRLYLVLLGKTKIHRYTAVMKTGGKRRPDAPLDGTKLVKQQFVVDQNLDVGVGEDGGLNVLHALSQARHLRGALPQPQRRSERQPGSKRSMLHLDSAGVGCRLEADERPKRTCRERCAPTGVLKQDVIKNKVRANYE